MRQNDLRGDFSSDHHQAELLLQRFVTEGEETFGKPGLRIGNPLPHHGGGLHPLQLSFAGHGEKGLLGKSLKGFDPSSVLDRDFSE